MGQNVPDERVIGSIWAFFSAYLLVFTICLLSVTACGVAPLMPLMQCWQVLITLDQA